MDHEAFAKSPLSWVIVGLIILLGAYLGRYCGSSAANRPPPCAHLGEGWQRIQLTSPSFIGRDRNAQALVSMRWACLPLTRGWCCKPPEEMR